MKKTWISSAHQGVVIGKMHSNTLSAFQLAADKGADMIETDARTSKDGVLFVNHDPIVRGFDENGKKLEYVISDTDSSLLRRVILAPEDPHGVQYLPTLEEALHLVYYTGMQINIDLKEGALHALDIARLVADYSMRGRTVYATNGADAKTMNEIIRLDPRARFIDTPLNYTSQRLTQVPDYPARCFIYTSDFSRENIRRIRSTGCMLASISLNFDNAEAGFSWHPEMAEYPHTSDFESIDAMILEKRP